MARSRSTASSALSIAAPRSTRTISARRSRAVSALRSARCTRRSRSRTAASSRAISTASRCCASPTCPRSRSISYLRPRRQPALANPACHRSPRPSPTPSPRPPASACATCRSTPASWWPEMDSLDTQVLAAARSWAAAGHRFALVTVARTWGSAPRPPGAWMILRDDGQVQGSVSGGCIEDDLIRRAASGEFTDELGSAAPRLLRYGVTAAEAHRFGLPCGGTLELVLAPAPDAGLLDQLAQLIAIGQLVHRRGADFALRGDDGAGARLSRLLLRSAQRIRRRLGRAGDRTDCRDARRRRQCAESRSAQRRCSADPRSQARRHGAARSAEIAGLLRRRAGLEGQQRQAPRAIAAVFRPLADRSRPPAWSGRPADRQPDAAGNRRRHPGRDDRCKKWPKLAIDRSTRRSLRLQDRMTEIVGLLLAAGRSQRFGSDKRLQPLADGTPMALAAARKLASACQRSIVVIRPGDTALAGLLNDAGLETLVCPSAEQGMGHSLAAGVAAWPDADGWLVALADMPYIHPASYRAVIAAMQGGARLARAFYGARPGHPVGFAAEHRAALLALTGDQGGKAILEAHPGRLVRCQVDDPGVLHDVDRPEQIGPP